MGKILAVTCLFAAIFGLTACGTQPSVDPIAETEDQPRSLENLLAERASDSGFSGVILVADNGEIILEHAYNPPGFPGTEPVTTDSRFAIASMTKSFTAVLMLQLVEDGRISLDDTLRMHLPDYPAAYADQVTIRHLLQNRSGIPHYVELPGWFDNTYKASLTEDSLVASIAELPLRFEPGADYLYANPNSYLLGLIVDRVTGQSYETVLAEQILNPLGLTDTGQIYEDQTRIALTQNFIRDDDGRFEPVPIVNPRLFRATASQYSTVRDLYRWHEGLKGDTLLSLASQDELFKPEAPMAWTVGALPLSEDVTVALQTYNGEMAGYTSMITRFPDRDGVVIILNNNNARYDFLSDLTVAIAAHLHGAD